MAAGATYKVVDHWAKHLRATLYDIEHTTLKVGVTEKSGKGEHPNANGKTVGDVAFFNEYGTMSQPARSFIRDWVDGNIDNIAKKMGTDVLRVIQTSEKMSEALTKRGVVYRAAIIRRILERIPPPNAESTIAAKGSDVPLIDTGTLLDAIVYEVSKGSKN